MSDEINDVEIEIDDEPEIEQEKEVKVMNDNTEYKRLKAKYEKEWFKLGNPACYGREENGTIQFKSSRDTQHIFEHIRVSITANGKKKNVSFFELWKKDSKIRYYDKVVFKPYPLVAKQNEYNLFTGYKIKETEIVPIDEFIEMLKSFNS